MTAVSRPVGIAHLEDPKVLDDLDLAQGQAVRAAARRRADDARARGEQPGQRPAGLCRAGVVAMVAGPGHAGMWVIVRRPAAGADQGAGGAVRRQLRGAATGLVPAATGGHAGGGQGVPGVRPGRLAGGPVPVAVAARPWRPRGRCSGGWTVRSCCCRCRCCWPSRSRAAYLGLAAYHDEIGLGTLAVMLPMLAATTPLGDISWDDVALSWMIQGLPRARELEAALRSAAGPGLAGVLARGRACRSRGPLRAGALPLPGRGP